MSEAQRGPLRLDVVGSNCVGKSAVVAELVRRHPAFSAVDASAAFEREFHLRTGLRRAMLLRPSAVGALAAVLMLRHERRLAIRFLAAYAATRQTLEGARGSVVLEEGFLKKLVETVEFEPAGRIAEVLKREAPRLARIAASHFDALVIVSVPDSVLVERAEKRSFLALAGSPDRLLDRCRRQHAVYEAVAARLEPRGVAVVRVDATDLAAAAESMSEALALGSRT